MPSSQQKKHIQDLHENENLFRKVIDTSSTAYLLYDNNTGFIDYVNPAFSKKFGDDLQTINDWWNKSFLDSQYREKIATDWMVRVDESSRNPEIAFEPMEVYVIDKNGEPRWIVMEAMPLHDSLTQTQLVTIYDISEIKKSHQALEENELRWKFALEGSGDGLWDWDLPSNKVVFSKQWKKMLGFSDSEIGTAFFEWSNRIHPEDIASVRSCMQKTLRREISSYSNKYRMRTKDGSYRWVVDRGTVVSFDKEGRPLRMIGTHTDIHEHKTLENRNEQLLRIIEESVDFIGMSDFEENIRYCNQAAKMMIDLPSDCAITDMKISNFHPEWAIKQIRDISIPHALTHGFWRGDSALLHKDGHEIPVSQILMVHKDGNGEVVALSTIMHDVTEQKNLEMLTQKAKQAAEQLAKSKSEFLANMSHEIRTPINAVLGLAFVLSKKNLPSDEKMLVKKIQTSGELLLGIINDVLDISKIESEKLELEHSEFDLNLVLDNLETIMTFSASEKAINLLIEPPSNLESVMLIGDSLRLQQVLVNLISNAIKFTENGHVCVAIECVERMEQRITLKFSVQDTGIGISPEAQKMIFSSFTQADTSITRNYGGTGLGLTISCKLVELMGGEISLESEIGKGSIFSFTLDFGLINKVTETVLPIEDITDVSPMRLLGFRLLIVDDNDVNLEVAKRIFSSEGAIVITARNGLEALEWLKENETGVDIVLMDIQMPVMDGCEATHEIRKIPALASIPIVALSAGVLKTQMDKVQHAGIQNFIIKPFNVDVAVNLIRKVLGSHFVEYMTKNVDESKTLSPKFEGVDVDNALENWREMHVYQTYLVQFLNDYELDLEKIETLNSDEIAGFAHKIKGSARVLGLFDVGDAAEELEIIADENQNTDDAIKTLKKAMSIASNSIHLIVQHL